MYSVILMAAMTTGGQAPDWHGCRECYGTCYGSCYGNYGIDGWNCCGGSNAYWGGCHGCWSSYASSYGTCTGAYNCTGSLYSWDWSSCGCNGCWGTYGNLSPYFPQTAPVVPGPPAVQTEPLAPPVKQPEQSAAPAKARLIVQVPADAKLYIDDHAMKTTSERHSYQTPELEPGQTFFYEVRAEVERDGKVVSETKRVLLRAGQEVHADFNDMTTTATAKAR